MTSSTPRPDYTHVLFDLDHTLFDTEGSLELAFGDAMAAVDVDAAGHYPTFQTINTKLWKLVEEGTLTPSTVHTRRFEQIDEVLSLDSDPTVMADAFATGLQLHGGLYAGARELLELLSTQVTMALVTNGISNIQRGRVERLGIAHFFETITISSEIGSAKPSPEIFETTFRHLGNPQLQATLMVGDSLSADIKGGERFGIDTCWYNPESAPLRADPRPTYEIRSLTEVAELIA